MSKEIYSFSKLTTWVDCKAAYHLIYNKKKPRQDSFFGLLGGGCHDIMEDFENGVQFDPLDRFAEVWQKSCQYPAHMDEKTDGFIRSAYYKKLEQFFSNIPKQTSPLYKTEQEILVPINKGDWYLRGFIDVVRDNGKILVDYKTNNPTGEYWNHESKIKQLYLYSAWVWKEFGYFPDKLIFWFIRYHADPKRRFKIENFSIGKFKETIAWANNIVKEIREYERRFNDKDDKEIEEYPTKSEEEMKEGLFCNVICGVRDSCTMRLNIDKIEKINKKLGKKKNI